MLSMTGFGTGDAPLGQGRVAVELRSLNHRFLDIRVKAPPELAEHAGLLEDMVRARIDRGRVEVFVRLEGDPGGEPELDVARARSAYLALAGLRDQIAPGEAVPLSLLAAVPDLFRARGRVAPADVRATLQAAFTRAAEALGEMRVREGRALADDLGARLARVRRHLEQARERAPQVIDAYRTRLRARIQKLLDSPDAALDAGRLEHEVAMFADRGDVAEEIARLAAHCEQFGELITAANGSVGRKLDFLLQEMSREANTLGAKSQDVETSRTVIEIKADLERMREQVQNVL